MTNLILILKTVSKTTKIAVHSNREQILLMNIRHSDEELNQFSGILNQLNFRKECVINELKRSGIELKQIGIIVCRGGVLKPIHGGVYRVNQAMVDDLYHPMAGHESNLGGLIAFELAKQIGKGTLAITADPACTDEMEEIARISGMPEIKRKSIMHTLSQRTVAKNYASLIGKKYAESNIIVAHLGSGISVGAHCNGRVIDVNNGIDGDGPMSAARCGSIPIGELVDMCFSGKYTKEEIVRKIWLEGGMKAYLGTSNAVEVEKRIEEGDEFAKLIYDSLAYQLAKEIGALATVLKGRVDGILITGGMAYSEYLMKEVADRISFIAPVRVYPGEREMEGLALNAYKVLNGTVEVIEYK